ncbi:MAG TPA: hypothetical protein VMF30_17065 [Pirellulales bacterium]|nr:hypothetical protein [Pirellulales bacterium]
MRDTKYATELACSTFDFPNGGGEARVERLRFKQPGYVGDEGYRFSWWKDGNMVQRPLDATEDQMIAIFKGAIEAGVFTGRFVAELRAMLESGSRT